MKFCFLTCQTINKRHFNLIQGVHSFTYHNKKNVVRKPTCADDNRLLSALASEKILADITGNGDTTERSCERGEPRRGPTNSCLEGKCDA